MVSADTEALMNEHEVIWIFDIGHWAFECPVPNIEYPTKFTFLIGEQIGCWCTGADWYKWLVLVRIEWFPHCTGGLANLRPELLAIIKPQLPPTITNNSQFYICKMYKKVVIRMSIVRLFVLNFAQSNEL